jgi:dTDP-4-dehydrorhamnose reductase
MNLLVVGTNGLLGSNVVSVGRQRDWNVSGTYHSTEPDFDIPLTRFDLRNYATFDNVLEEYDPDVVVNCAAMTDVDACEEELAQAHLLNGEAPGALAEHCETYRTEFVHVSTDYVFAGERRGPYSESADTNPVQVYGESKLAGEQTVQSKTDALVARLSFVYGVHRSTGRLTGFPSWVQSRVESGEEIPLFQDQWITPTRAGQAAATLLDLVERGTTGPYHVACNSCVTPYEFGEELVDQFGHGTELLVEGSMGDVDRAATRPQYTCLSVDKVESTLGRAQPTLREDIEQMCDAVSAKSGTGPGSR